MTNSTMTIRDMCDAFDVTPRTLRFYEAKELLFPTREGQKRLYSKRDRARLKLIMRGKQFGFSLEEIRNLLDLYHTPDGEAAQMIQTYDLAQQHLRTMEANRASLESAITELKEHMAWGKEKLADMANAQSVAA